eukprot:jgi/Mesvir1/15366/Mv06564-RA.2
MNRRLQSTGCQLSSGLPLKGKHPRVAIVTDLDSTLVDHSDRHHKALVAFNQVWEQHFQGNSLLVYATGRSPHSFLQLMEEVPLRVPDVAILSVGTDMFVCDSGAHQTGAKRAVLPDRPDPGWEAVLAQGWDRGLAEQVVRQVAPDLALQPEHEQRPFKLCFNTDPATAAALLPQLEAKLQQAGVG